MGRTDDLSEEVDGIGNSIQYNSKEKDEGINQVRADEESLQKIKSAQKKMTSELNQLHSKKEGIEKELEELMSSSSDDDDDDFDANVSYSIRSLQRELEKVNDDIRDRKRIKEEIEAAFQKRKRLWMLHMQELMRLRVVFQQFIAQLKEKQEEADQLKARAEETDAKIISKLNTIQRLELNNPFNRARREAAGKTRQSDQISSKCDDLTMTASRAVSEIDSVVNRGEKSQNLEKGSDGWER